MFNRNFIGLAAAAVSGLLASRLATDMTPAEAYRTVKPVTTKNIGRDWLKMGRGRYLPHQGEREKARRRRQLAAGQIHFIQHGPSARAAARSSGRAS